MIFRMIFKKIVKNSQNTEGVINRTRQVLTKFRAINDEHLGRFDDILEDIKANISRKLAKILRGVNHIRF
jgi:hypothetical protein